VNTDDRKLVGLIREALPPLGEPPPGVDLWPRFERRLLERRRRPATLDWLMAVLVLGLLAGFPEAVLLVLYYL
jgi:hypothetical protein